MKKLLAMLVFLVLMTPALVVAQVNPYTYCAWTQCYPEYEGDNSDCPRVGREMPQDCTECVWNDDPAQQRYLCVVPEQAEPIPELGTVGIVILLAVAAGGLFWVSKKKK
jgi:hypothetical protein